MTDSCDHDWRLYNGSISSSWTARKQDYYRYLKCGLKKDEPR